MHDNSGLSCIYAKKNDLVNSLSEIATNASRRAVPRSDERDKLDTGYLLSPTALRAELEALHVATAQNIARSKSEATTRAYATAFGAFELWCHQYELAALPAQPDTVALYLTALAERGGAVATLRARIVAISQAHKAAGLPVPTESQTVRRVMSGIARIKGTRQRRVTALRTSTLKKMLAALEEDTLLSIRDRAILLLGFAGGMRRSEIAALDVEDITDVDAGIDVLIRRSKTDQEGAGRTIGIPAGRSPETSPVIAVHRWIRVAGLTSGPLFPVIVPNGRPQTDEEAKKKPKKHEKGRIGTRRLSAQGIARIVQRAAKRIGLDPGEFAGHSLRAGFATEAAAQGASERAIMRQTGHRSVEMVRRYIRDGDRYRDNAATYLGL